MGLCGFCANKKFDMDIGWNICKKTNKIIKDAYGQGCYSDYQEEDYSDDFDDQEERLYDEEEEE